MPNNRVDAGKQKEWVFPLFLFGSLALSTFFAIAQRGRVDGPMLIACGLIALVAVLYLPLAQPALMDDDQRRGTAYLSVCVPVTVSLFFVSSAYMSSLFGAFPLCYSMVDRKRTQLLYAAMLSCGVAIGNAYYDDWVIRGWMNGIVIGAVSLLFSAVMGSWIGNVITESRGRKSLIDELQATRAELAQAQHNAGAREERELLSAEIHDTLTQGFSSILMLARSAQRSLEHDPSKAMALLHSVEETAQENLNEARALVNSLAPVPLQNATLADALLRIGERFQTESGIICTTMVAGDASTAGLSASEEVVVLRAVQESLTNVRRHAQATKVSVSLDYASKPVCAQVIDNGRGFADQSDPSESRGLSGLRARLANVGGSLSVDSRPGRTAVVVTLR